MTIMHYGSGDEIRPGDKVECADGIIGEVVFTLTPGETTKSDSLCQGYVVRKTDGTEIHYQSSNNSVRLLSRVNHRASDTISTTIKKKEFLQLMEDLGSHSLYYPDPISKSLVECGISTDVAPDGQGILVEGHLITVNEPEWGEPGISPLAILSVIYEISTGEPPHSEMTGMGFRFRDALRKLANYWCLDAKN